MQLPPVNKFNENEVTKSPTFNVKSQFELIEIVRQNRENPLTQLLEIIVSDIKNDGSSFLTYLLRNPRMVNSEGEGYEIYTDKELFISNAIECFKKDEFAKDPDYGRIAAWKNDTVKQYNTAVRNSLIPYFSGTDSEKELIDTNDLLIGYKTITDEFNETVLINSEDYVVLEVFPRMAEHGFKSYNVKIKPRHGGKAVDISIVDYRDKSFLVYYEKIKQKYFNALYAHHSVKSSKWKDYFLYKDSHLSLITFPIKDGDVDKAYVTKDIDYAFSLTTHKLQGSTIENTFIDLTDMLYYSTGRAVLNSNFSPKAVEIRNKLIYTAISRTSKFCHIYLNLK